MVIGPLDLDAVGGCHLVIVWLIRRSLLHIAFFVQPTMAKLAQGTYRSVRLNFPSATYQSKYQYSGKGNRAERYPRQRIWWAACE